jgi:hypothetical protein
MRGRMVRTAMARRVGMVQIRLEALCDTIKQGIRFVENPRNGSKKASGISRCERHSNADQFQRVCEKDRGHAWSKRTAIGYETKETVMIRVSYRPKSRPSSGAGWSLVLALA